MELANIDQTEAAPALASFTIEPAALGDAVALLAKRLVERRNTIPILSNVLICADVSGLITLTATDLDIQAAIELPADVESPGLFTCDAGLLSDILAKARKDKGAARVNVSDNGDRVVLMTGRARNVLPRLPADDFPTVKFGDALPVSFTVPGAQFIADLAALAPCVSKEESRYYLRGVAIQARNLAGADRLAMIATTGGNMAIASRELPNGAAAMPDAIIPDKVAALLRHVAKFALTCDALGVEYLDNRFRFTLGGVVITAKAIDGTFPDWARPWEVQLAPTGEAMPMFPGLLPAAPLGSMEKIGKAIKAPMQWEPAQQGMIGTVPGDDGLLFGCFHSGEATSEPVKGYRIGYDADAGAALRYLCAIADQKAGAHVTRDNCRLRVHAGEVQGLTVGDCTWHNGATVWAPGAYSIVMPRERAKLAPDCTVIIDGDSTVYPLGVKGNAAIHLTKEQVREIARDSVFETMAVTIAGRVIYILRWLFEQGDSRFLTVRADGRCFTGKDASKAMYLSRGQVEAALRGEVEPDAAPMPEIASPAPAQDESAPIAAQESGEAVNALTGAEIAPVELVTVADDLPAPAAPDLEAITARLDALEAALATLSAESTGLIPAPSNESAEIITPPTARAKRTAAHERAIRRAWAERKARRDAERKRDATRRNLQVAEESNAAEYRAWKQAREALETERDKWEADCRANFAHAGKMNAKRRATAQRARRMIAAARVTHAESINRMAAQARTAIDASQAELARLKRDMADPMQPERASDIARLVGERDTARTALAAMAARAERAEQTVNAMADRFEGLVSRVTKAEAALRQANAA